MSGVGNTWIVWSIDGKLLENFDRHDLKDRFLGGLEDDQSTVSVCSLTDLGNGIRMSDQGRFDKGC